MAAQPRRDVRKALAGEWPGRVLRGELAVDDGFVRDLVGLAEEAVPWRARRAVLDRLRHDLVVVPFSHGWGSPVQPDRQEAQDDLARWRSETPLFVLALIDGPFSLAARAWGWEEALVRLARPTGDVARFMADAVVQQAELVQQLAAAGADGVVLGDDIAYRRSTYVQPAALRESYFPYLTALVEAAQQAGLPVVFHSDGNLWEVLDDLAATGVNGLQGLEPAAGMSLAAVRARVGPDLCLWGNVDVGWLAQPRPPAEITAEVRRMLAPLLGTPVILGTSGGLMAGLPGVHVEAMAAAADPEPSG
ncbi:MAG: uroporphyrinogen decarboxylase family protein [Caldilineales bacterium]|nr:uroporphyrinogen decarboxylase family protein [Caldilineales bacterium]MDW8318054.1 uroporphyrinogen decarboxylase family protein [Anaerolineae bacterium]